MIDTRYMRCARKEAGPAVNCRAKAGRIPAPVLYAAGILILVLLALILLPRVFAVRRDIQTRFLESLIEAKGNRGDVLEVATISTAEVFSETDKFDFTVLGFPIPAGTTKVTLSIPVTFRFHVLLSDSWRIATTEETVTVDAPEVRPSLPPAPDLSAMDITTEQGPLRFNRKEVEERVRARVTGELNLRAHRLARSQVARDVARSSVERHLKEYVRWLPDECRDKTFVVRFRGETGGKEAGPIPRSEPSAR